MKRRSPTNEAIEDNKHILQGKIKVLTHWKKAYVSYGKTRIIYHN